MAKVNVDGSSLQAESYWYQFSVLHPVIFSVTCFHQRMPRSGHAKCCDEIAL